MAILIKSIYLMDLNWVITKKVPTSSHNPSQVESCSGVRGVLFDTCH